MGLLSQIYDNRAVGYTRRFLQDIGIANKDGYVVEGHAPSPNYVYQDSEKTPEFTERLCQEKCHFRKGLEQKLGTYKNKGPAKGRRSLKSVVPIPFLGQGHDWLSGGLSYADRKEIVEGLDRIKEAYMQLNSNDNVQRRGYRCFLAPDVAAQIIDEHVDTRPAQKVVKRLAIDAYCSPAHNGKELREDYRVPIQKAGVEAETPSHRGSKADNAWSSADGEAPPQTRSEDIAESFFKRYDASIDTGLASDYAIDDLFPSDMKQGGIIYRGSRAFRVGPQTTKAIRETVLGIGAYSAAADVADASVGYALISAGIAIGAYKVMSGSIGIAREYITQKITLPIKKGVKNITDKVSFLPIIGDTAQKIGSNLETIAGYNPNGLGAIISAGIIAVGSAIIGLGYDPAAAYASYMVIPTGMITGSVACDYIQKKCSNRSGGGRFLKGGFTLVKTVADLGLAFLGGSRLYDGIEASDGHDDGGSASSGEGSSELENDDKDTEDKPDNKTTKESTSNLFTLAKEKVGQAYDWVTGNASQKEIAAPASDLEKLLKDADARIIEVDDEGDNTQYAHLQKGITLEGKRYRPNTVLEIEGDSYGVFNNGTPVARKNFVETIADRAGDDDIRFFNQQGKPSEWIDPNENSDELNRLAKQRLGRDYGLNEQAATGNAANVHDAGADQINPPAQTPQGRQAGTPFNVIEHTYHDTQGSDIRRVYDDDGKFRDGWNHDGPKRDWYDNGLAREYNIETDDTHKVFSIHQSENSNEANGQYAYVEGYVKEDVDGDGDLDTRLVSGKIIDKVEDLPVVNGRHVIDLNGLTLEDSAGKTYGIDKLSGYQVGLVNVTDATDGKLCLEFTASESIGDYSKGDYLVEAEEGCHPKAAVGKGHTVVDRPIEHTLDMKIAEVPHNVSESLVFEVDHKTSLGDGVEYTLTISDEDKKLLVDDHYGYQMTDGVLRDTPYSPQIADTTDYSVDLPEQFTVNVEAFDDASPQLRDDEDYNFNMEPGTYTLPNHRIPTLDSSDTLVSPPVADPNVSSLGRIDSTDGSSDIDIEEEKINLIAFANNDNAWDIVDEEDQDDEDDEILGKIIREVMAAREVKENDRNV